MLVLLAQVAHLSSIPASTSGGVGTVTVTVTVAFIFIIVSLRYYLRF